MVPEAAAAPTDANPVHREVEQVMGMPISLALRGRHAGSVSGREAWRSVITDLRAVDAVFSTYRPDSVISRLGRGELDPADCPDEVGEVLEIGRRAERESAGAFSILLPDGSGGRRLDPSGVVKGWAVQRASAHLAALPDTDFCLSAGGDLVCRVADPTRPAWRIGIEHPHHVDTIIATVPVRDGAVATSGAARRGGHILDPRTGRAAAGAASVTVIGRDLTWVDIDATAAFVHGAAAADWLRTRTLTSALVVWPDGSTTTVDGRLRAPGARPPGTARTTPRG